ncbi:MAG: serine/threonine protein kinase [Planctomycetes bacterium]|nr:serine/threonine protein kinase [Planctomycetota bacterium]
MLEETVTIQSSSSADAQEPVEIPRQIGHVRLGEQLGQGASGVVFAAYDEALNRRVAVKVLHQLRVSPEAGGLAGFMAGVRSAAHIKHPNIIGVYNVESVRGMPVIVMEYVSGASLRDLVERTHRLDTPLAVYLATAIAAGVAALHEAQIVHRDLKPANILFDRDGQAYVCDFGLACEFRFGARAVGSEKIAGSPLYMSPEMFEGVISPQSDVYALGVMLFEMLAGRPPFSADTIEEMKAYHRHTPVPIEWLDDLALPDELGDVIARCMHKQRIMRYKSAEHLLRALARYAPASGRDELYRQRIAQLVAAPAGQTDTPRADEPPESSAHTMFDLVTRRAQKKRDSKGN